MCGIVGFTGVQQAAPILLDGLSKLEYRGYDSAGIAVRNGENETEVVKAKGRLKALAEKTDNGTAVIGSCGIGHTRWATHGGVTDTNAHPHNQGKITLVHNGIIENYEEIKKEWHIFLPFFPFSTQTLFSMMLTPVFRPYISFSSPPPFLSTNTRQAIHLQVHFEAAPHTCIFFSAAGHILNYVLSPEQALHVAAFFIYNTVLL